MNGQTIVDTLGNQLKGDFLSMNIHYRTSNSSANYGMRYPQTLTISLHDTTKNQITGNFEGIFERSSTDTLLIKGEFNVFYN